MKATVLFDGECHFCNKSVQFIMKRDPKGYFCFASLQGEVGQTLLKKHEVPVQIDSFVLIENNKVFLKSNAALRVCRHLKGTWKLLYLFLIIPTFIRDAVYSIIAHNRYKLFGKGNSCMMPTPDIRERFLD